METTIFLCRLYHFAIGQAPPQPLHRSKPEVRHPPGADGQLHNENGGPYPENRQWSYPRI